MKNVLLSLLLVAAASTSKLLARKRPRLTPIVDSVIRDHLGLGDDDEWLALRAALEDPDLREAIDRLRPTGASTRVATLRLLDAATLDALQESKAARKVRHEAGLPLNVLGPNSP